MTSFPVAGVRAGHWTGAGTGVTVLLAPDGTIGAGEVRGGAPATRELALLEPGRTVTRVDAVVFAGGSAFGLAAADGVMRYLAERGQGFATAGGSVPIVPAAAIFDLAENAGARPGSGEGYAAAVIAARDGPLATGRVGAGCGATVGKWRGREYAAPGGVGIAHERVGDATVAALAVVNAIGDVVGDDGQVTAGSSAPDGALAFPDPRPFEETANTTLVVVVTDGQCDQPDCHLMAQSAHDGLARSLRPSHTRFDGDVAVALATGAVPVHLDRLRVGATQVVAAAVRAAVIDG
ncbi:MAG: P1 family peptidase [Actinomycetota bacterium]